jgi:broad specificity phosphatase PhoE
MLHRTVKAVVLALLLTTALAAQAPGRPTIFLVRHAERADASGAPPMGADPDLSDVGRRRAESLASLLKDAGVTAIFVTEFKRTQQTAAPLAQQAGIMPVTINADRTADLVAKLKTATGTGNILVVGHSNTVPEVIKSLGITTPITIGDSDFDNLFVITQNGTAKRFVHLHYR